jgi:proline iminopeptidase
LKIFGQISNSIEKFLKRQKPLRSNGEILESRGAKIWYKVSGAEHGPITIFLHGGPGYNSYSFEKYVGARLEKKLRMVYLDQRDSGRSVDVSTRGPVSLKALIDDVEQIRIRSGFKNVNLIGHSFGGLVALEYQHHYPAFVDKIILIDITFDLPACFQHQIDHAAKVFPEHAEAIKKIQSSDQPPFIKVREVSASVGTPLFQKALLWSDSENYQKYLKTAFESKMPPGGSRLIRQLVRNNYLDSAHPELAEKIRVPALLLSGRHSQCIGVQNLQKASAQWGIPLIWFERSGHFPYAEESEAFVETATAFLIR